MIFEIQIILLALFGADGTEDLKPIKDLFKRYNEKKNEIDMELTILAEGQLEITP